MAFKKMLLTFCFRIFLADGHNAEGICHALGLMKLGNLVSWKQGFLNQDFI